MHVARGWHYCLVCSTNQDLSEHSMLLVTEQVISSYLGRFVPIVYLLQYLTGLCFATPRMLSAEDVHVQVNLA